MARVRSCPEVLPDYPSVWTQPERIVAEDKKEGEILVKWQGLNYDDCTWEPIEARGRPPRPPRVTPSFDRLKSALTPRYTRGFTRGHTRDVRLLEPDE